MKPGEWDLFRVSPGESHWTAKWRLTWEGRREGPGRRAGAQCTCSGLGGSSPVGPGGSSPVGPGKGLAG